MRRITLTSGAFATLTLALAVSTTARPALAEPPFPSFASADFTDQLLQYSEQLGREITGWLDEESRRPPASSGYENPYADLSAAWLGRMREQDAVLDACAAGDPAACAQREQVLDRMARDTQALGAIAGMEQAYDQQRELGAEWRRKELYRRSREWGYSASDIIQ